MPELLLGFFLIKVFLCSLIVSFRLGEVLDPYTKLHMVIHGDKGDTDKIYLTPKGERLEPGKLYTVTVNTKDVGNVSEGCTGNPTVNVH